MQKQFSPLTRYTYAYGFSAVGDWMNVLAVNWLTVHVLSGATEHNMLRSAVAGAFSTAAALWTLRNFDPRRALLRFQVYCCVISAVEALLIHSGGMSIGLLFALELPKAVFGVLAGPGSDMLIRELGGQEQCDSSYRIQQAFWFARLITGFAAYPLSLLGLEWLLLCDSLSFVPMIIFVWGWTPAPVAADGKDEGEEEEVSVSFRIGFHEIFSNRRHIFVLAFRTLEFFAYGLSFWMATEILRNQFGGDLTMLSIWLMCTGIGSTVGNLIARKFSRWLNGKQQFIYLSCLGVCLVLQIIGGGTTVWIWYLVFYAAGSLFAPAVLAIGPAYFRNFEKSKVGSVSRAVNVQSSIIGWLLPVYCVTMRGFGFEQLEMVRIGAASSLLCFLTLIIFALVICRRLFDTWFVEELEAKIRKRDGLSEG